MSGLLDKVVVVTGAAAAPAGPTASGSPTRAPTSLRSISIRLQRIWLRSPTRSDNGADGVSPAWRTWPDLAAVREAVDAGVAGFGRLDVVVANAGVHSASVPSWEVAPEDWQRIMTVNLTGVWHTVTAYVRHFGPGGGSVVIISSANGLRGTANTAPYTSSKHALVGLARRLANELGPKRIRVNTVHPGAVGTAMVLNDTTFKRIRPDLPNPTAQDAAEVLAGRNLLPVPWVEPVDISNAVVFLASDEGRYITGTALVVDAGLTREGIGSCP